MKLQIPYLFVVFCLVSCQVKSDGSADPAAPRSPAKAAVKKTTVNPKPAVNKTVSATGTSKKNIKKATAKKVLKKARSLRRKAAGIKWQSNVKWQDWANGRQQAADEGKPLCLLIYTNWCPRCRELAPLFRDPSLEALSKKLVMVKQDQDERPAWLNEYVNAGRYVPRILFFGADGQLRSDITSGISKYPYFYTPRSLVVLKASMKRALEK